MTSAILSYNYITKPYSVDLMSLCVILFLFGMVAMPLPLWFGDSMQGQTLAYIGNVELIDLGYLSTGLRFRLNSKDNH